MRGPTLEVGKPNAVAGAASVPVYFVRLTLFTLLRLKTLKASAMSCRRAPLNTPMSRVRRGSNETCDGRRSELRVKPGARSLLGLPAPLRSAFSTAEYGGRL